MAAALAIGTMALVETLLRLRARDAGLARLPALAALALLPGLLLALAFVVGAAGAHETHYGVGPLDRLIRVARGDAFAPIGRTTALASALAGAMLGLLALWGARAALAEGGATAGIRRLRLALCAVPFAFLGFLLLVPEQAGGGWTHVWRAEVFPFIGLALAAAALPQVPAALRGLAVGVAGAGGLAAIAMMAWLQTAKAPPVAAEFAALDALVGPHCTLAPMFEHFRLDAANSARLIHEPLMHIANRLELRQDRPVLYNYLVRLSVYPIRYRAEADPTRHLFGWAPGQRGVQVRRFLAEAFEARAGIAVDYVLLWDMPADAHGAALRAALGVGYGLAHRSASGRLELYRRQGPGGCGAP